GANPTRPTAPAPGRPTHARAAIAGVPVVPPVERHFDGTIVGSLAALDGFPAFAPVIGLLDVRRDPSAVISEMTETFARVYLANAHDVLTAIAFVHGVTGATAVRPLLPWVPAHADPALP